MFVKQIKTFPEKKKRKTSIWLRTTEAAVGRCSIKKGVLRNFTKFTGKHLCQSLFLNKVAGLRRVPVNFVKFLRTSFLIEHLWWLFLEQIISNIKLFY